MATGERQLAALVEFTDALPDGRLKSRLQAAISHPDAFDRWYRALERDPAVADRWDAETDLRVVAEALAWLAEHGITPVPPAKPAPEPVLIPDTIPVAGALPRPATKPSNPRPKKRKR